MALPIRLLPIGVALILATVSSAQNVTHERTLLTVPSQGDAPHLGEYVRIEGRWAFVGAPMDSTVQTFAGAVYVYERTANGWTPFTTLHPRPSPTTAFYSENAIDSAGDYLAVGSRFWIFDLANATTVGKVFIYKFNGTTWVLHAEFMAPDLPTFTVLGGFGHSVAFAGPDELLVGAPGSNCAPSDPLAICGAIYVFRRNALDQWVFVQKLPGPGTPQTHVTSFGSWISVAGDSAISLGYGLRAGEIERDANGVWHHVSQIQVPMLGDPVAYDVAYDGNTVAIGDIQRACSGTIRPARVYIYHRGPNGWQIDQELFPSNSYFGPFPNCSLSNDGFGRRLRMRNGRLAVGAISAPNGAGPGFGSITLFDEIGGQWVETDQLWLSSPRRSSGLGISMDFDGQTIVAGAPFWADVPMPLVHPGAVAFFDLPLGPTVCPGEPNQTGSAGHLAVLGSPSISIGDLYVQTNSLPPSALCLGLVGSDPGFAPHPGGSRGNLCLSGSLGRFVQQAGPASAAGTYTFEINMQSVPLAVGATSIQQGESWTFQLWYRDALATGMPTSNFSSAMTATFR